MPQQVPSRPVVVRTGLPRAVTLVLLAVLSGVFVWQVGGRAVGSAHGAFVAIGLLAMLSGYWLAARFVATPVALAAPAAIGAFFAGAAAPDALAALGAGALAVLAVALVMRRRWLLGAVAVCASVVLVEPMAFLVVPFVVAWSTYGRRRDEVAAVLIATIPPVALTLWRLTRALTGAHAALLRPGGASAFLAALRFPAGAGVLGGLLLLAPVLALLGAAQVAERWRRLFLGIGVAGAAASVAALSGRGASVGVILQPLALAVAPLVLARALPSPFALATARKPRDPDGPHTVWIVLPAYNEEASLGELLGRMHDVMTAEAQPYRVIVVDDGSTDATASIAEKSAARLPVTLVRHPHNLGLGATIADGLREAAAVAERHDVVVTMDADLTQDPRYIPSMIRAYGAGADVVIASRFRHGSSVAGVSAFRRFMTGGARVVLATFMHVEGVRDYSCGFRLYDVEVLQEAFAVLGDDFITERGFACMAEILVKLRHRARIVEVPFALHYEEKRKASSMRVSRTAMSYFGVVARTAWLELRGVL